MICGAQSGAPYITDVKKHKLRQSHKIFTRIFIAFAYCNSERYMIQY